MPPPEMFGVSVGDQRLGSRAAPASSASDSSALPMRKRICDRREPVRTTIGKVRGLTSR